MFGLESPFTVVNGNGGVVLTVYQGWRRKYLVSGVLSHSSNSSRQSVTTTDSFTNQKGEKVYVSS